MGGMNILHSLPLDVAWQMSAVHLAISQDSFPNAPGLKGIIFVVFVWVSFVLAWLCDTFITCPVAKSADTFWELVASGLAFVRSALSRMLLGGKTTVGRLSL